MGKACAPGIICLCAFVLLSGCNDQRAGQAEKAAAGADEAIEKHVDGYVDYVSNIAQNGRIQDQYSRRPVRTAIYNLSYVVYSREFAERFGYSKENIVELQPGLQMMQFQMETTGDGIRCRLALLLDKGQGHFLQNRDKFHLYFVYGRTDFHWPFHMPARYEGSVESEADKDFRLKHGLFSIDGGGNYSQAVFLAGQDYYPTKEKGGSMISVNLDDYNSMIIDRLDYFVITIGCTSLSVNNFKEENSHIWIQRSGGPDFSSGGIPYEKYFLRYRIPEEIKKKAVPVMERFALKAPFWADDLYNNF